MMSFSESGWRSVFKKIISRLFNILLSLVYIDVAIILYNVQYNKLGCIGRLHSHQTISYLCTLLES